LSGPAPRRGPVFLGLIQVQGPADNIFVMPEIGQAAEHDLLGGHRTAPVNGRFIDLYVYPVSPAEGFNLWLSAGESWG